MADLLLRFLVKAGHALNNPFAMNQGYLLPRHGDGRRDWQRVAGDLHVVSKDLKKIANRELKEHGR
jgi:hypothetical protein